MIRSFWRWFVVTRKQNPPQIPNYLDPPNWTLHDEQIRTKIRSCLRKFVNIRLRKSVKLWIPENLIQWAWRKYKIFNSRHWTERKRKKITIWDNKLFSWFEFRWFRFPGGKLLGKCISLFNGNAEVLTIDKWNECEISNGKCQKLREYERDRKFLLDGNDTKTMEINCNICGFKRHTNVREIKRLKSTSFTFTAQMWEENHGMSESLSVLFRSANVISDIS